MDLRFEWDRQKAILNEAKHGMAFAEALTVFSDPLARIFDDPDHSSAEAHEVIIGHSNKDRLLVVLLHRARGGDPTRQCSESHEAGATGL